MPLYIPEPQQALEELKPLTNAVNDFLLEATDHVLPYFLQRGLPPDPTAGNDMFRYELSRQLKTNCNILDLNYQPLIVKKLNNNGIQCTFAGWTIKIFHGSELYPPGYSNSRLAFFRQESFFNYSMLQDLFPEEDKSRRPNIVLLWQFSNNYTTLNQWLALPASVLTRWSPVECHWKIQVPEDTPNNSGQTPTFINFLETPDSVNDPADTEPDFQEPEIKWKEPQEQEDDTDDGAITDTGPNPRE